MRGRDWPPSRPCQEYQSRCTRPRNKCANCFFVYPSDLLTRIGISRLYRMIFDERSGYSKKSFKVGKTRACREYIPFRLSAKMNHFAALFPTNQSELTTTKPHPMLMNSQNDHCNVESQVLKCPMRFSALGINGIFSAHHMTVSPPLRGALNVASFSSSHRIASLPLEADRCSL